MSATETNPWVFVGLGSVVKHASHNLYIQGFFDQVTTDTGITEYLTGEFGAAVVVVASVVAYFFWRRRGELAPSNPPEH